MAITVTSSYFILEILKYCGERTGIRKGGVGGEVMEAVAFS